MSLMCDMYVVCNRKLTQMSASGNFQMSTLTNKVCVAFQYSYVMFNFLATDNILIDAVYIHMVS